MSTTDFTTGVIPRWTADIREGTSEYVLAVPDGLAQAADRLAVPQHVLVLAVHAKVLALLTGEDWITAGYVRTEGEGFVQFGLAITAGSWRQLVAAVHQAEQEVRRPDGPGFETVVDPTGCLSPAGLPPEVSLAASFQQDKGVLRLHYRMDVADEDYAERIAGYHHKALALLIADPDADHRAETLLSDQELAYQLTGLAGPSRDRPNRRFHELFEQRAREHPEVIAAVHDRQRLTYGELNKRANRIARALVARGARAETVVAVVADRGLQWMAAVIAVFKAGAVYLPIEPGFPADRIATMISRAGCGFALVEHGARAVLPSTGLDVLVIDSLVHADGDDTDPRVPVGPDQVAYIYFTSGSTGEPKGAMCEHAGMLNHLYAKVEDVGLGADDVVAQVAPQCFDISLWQLLCALLVGGRTVIVAQEEILDAERFLRRLVTGRVSVLQVVPSYLDVLLSHVEQGYGGLAGVRCVLVTGEEVRKDLVRRWFTARPGVPVINAYGLTETSDDTNHEVMTEPPRHSRVPLGPPVANVRAYVVDEDLRPVPLGAAGELVFAGVCVGRGYVNDPDRTRRAFGPDPFHPTERLYRTGDRGRWLPGGKLEYLGRADGQVKIRGFRVELGEVESRLQAVPGVRGCAVVVAGPADGGKHLVGFYHSAEPLPAEQVRAQLSQSLPAYMVPASLHSLKSLPLTGNGKINRKALAQLAELTDTRPAEHLPAGTPMQHRLAAAWSAVLNIPADQIGQEDHFFERGGTSLSAVRMAIALDRLVSPGDVIRFPVLADMAVLLEERVRERQP
jgi:amino acid adenylation domain-containing protein